MELSLRVALRKLSCCNCTKQTAATSKRVATIQRKNLIIAGMPRSGKTLIWLRLAFPQVALAKMLPHLSSTELPAAEEAVFDRSYIVWDTPSNPDLANATISALACSITEAVLFTLSCDSSPEEIAQARLHLAYLLNHSLLSSTLVVLIINCTTSDYDENKQLSEAGTEKLFKILILINVSSFEEIYGDRFKWNICDAKEGLPVEVLQELIHED